MKRNELNKRKNQIELITYNVPELTYKQAEKAATFFYNEIASIKTYIDNHREEYEKWLADEYSQPN